MDETLPELEVQQEVERFATQFTDRVTQATEGLERSSATPEVRDEALRKNLRYVWAALEIATGPLPEINLLDMMIFVRLCGVVIERHWIPELYGARGRELAEVFSRSDQELAEVAAKVLTPMQREQLAQLIDAWLKENPDQRRVEGIRLSGLSSVAGEMAAERLGQAKGLLASVRGASRFASQALLLSERAMFLFHRLPFLWRLQARVGAREIIGDTGRQARHVVRRGAFLAALSAGAGMFAWWAIKRFRSARGAASWSARGTRG
jgi:hypothetical protein